MKLRAFVEIDDDCYVSVDEAANHPDLRQAARRRLRGGQRRNFDIYCALRDEQRRLPSQTEEQHPYKPILTVIR